MILCHHVVHVTHLIYLIGGVIMRREASRRKDARYFRQTASHTKAVNLAQKIFRGGIRF